MSVYSPDADLRAAAYNRPTLTEMSHNGSSETSSFIDECWASWFCNLAGNQFFCEVDKAYIEDSFNLFGLKQHLNKDYSKALDAILDRLAPNETESEDLSRSAAFLYGLIHARYIITAHGLEAMHRKYVQREFGECPRMLCRGQPVLPMGFTDDPKHGMVKLFCPKCQDVYSCAPAQRHIDGAFFGPTFPNLFFMTYEELVPEPATEQYVPRVFGFRIHHSSNSSPRLGNGSRSAMSLYSGFSGRSGLGGLSAGTSMAAIAAAAPNPGSTMSHFGQGAVSLLTYNNLTGTGNHTSASISESQSAATQCVTVGGKRRHHPAATGTDGNGQGTMKGASSMASSGESRVSVSAVIQDTDAAPVLHIASSGNSSSPTPSGTAYTGLDGVIGIDTRSGTPTASNGTNGTIRRAAAEAVSGDYDKSDEDDFPVKKSRSASGNLTSSDHAMHGNSGNLA